MSKTQKKLVMEFDPTTIEHLGIQMYSTLPPVLAELVANSYDAEARKVEIFLYDKPANKRIIVKDNGHGMTFDEIIAVFKRKRPDNRNEQTSPECLAGLRVKMPLLTHPVIPQNSAA